jgi:DNA-binding transcriptional regulator YhcF (GntR family)
MKMPKLSDYLKDLNEGRKLEISGNIGYVITPNCIRRCLRVSQEEKLLLFEIYSFYNDEKGSAYPTQTTLAMYVGTTPSTVTKHLKTLEEKGFIKSRGGRGRKKQYFPSFELHSNPYILVSEWFHFASKAINMHIYDSAKNEIAAHLTRYINVRKCDEFTSKDQYGRFITLAKHNNLNEVRSEFLNNLTNYLSVSLGMSLTINWQLEINNLKEKRIPKKEKGRKEFYRNSSGKLSLEADNFTNGYNNIFKKGDNKR